MIVLSSSWLGSHPNLSGSRNRDLSTHLIWGTQSSKVSQSTSNALKTRQDKVASRIAWPLSKRKYLLPWLQKLIYLEPQVQGILSVASSSPCHLPCLSAEKLCWDWGFLPSPILRLCLYVERNAGCTGTEIKQALTAHQHHWKLGNQKEIQYF